MDDWSINIKPGDQVAMRRGYGYATHSILTVDRVTASQVIAGNLRFRKDTRRLVGNSSQWESITMHPVTQEIRDAVESRELRDWLNGLLRTNQPLDVMRAMKAAYDAASRAEEPK